MEARGIRNNNPLNIRRSADKWQGLKAQQEDREFFQFSEMKWGGALHSGCSAIPTMGDIN